MEAKITTAVVVPFHCYTPFGSQYYQPIFDYFLQNYMKNIADDVTKLYILDSGDNVAILKNTTKRDIEVIKVDPNERYWEVYEQIIPMLTQDVVLFLDDDMVIYRKDVVSKALDKIREGFDIVSIFDTIGTLTDRINSYWPQMNGKSKFCPYFFMARVKLLQSIPKLRLGTIHYGSREFIKELNYFTVSGDWVETLGEATIKLLAAGAKVYELEEDKSNLPFEGELDRFGSKDLGYYHIRAGSTPAYLLAHKFSLDQTEQYKKYIKEQPRSELLRHLAWYWIMATATDNVDRKGNVIKVIDDLKIDPPKWFKYIEDFQKFHGL